MSVNALAVKQQQPPALSSSLLHVHRPLLTVAAVPTSHVSLPQNAGSPGPGPHPGSLHRPAPTPAVGAPGSTNDLCRHLTDITSHVTRTLQGRPSLSWLMRQEAKSPNHSGPLAGSKAALRRPRHHGV